MTDAATMERGKKIIGRHSGVLIYTICGRAKKKKGSGNTVMQRNKGENCQGSLGGRTS